MWFVVALYWAGSAFAVKKSLKQQSVRQRTSYMICVLLAFSLLFQDFWNFSFLGIPVLAENESWKSSGLMVCVLGLVWAIWARIYLGKNWSGRVTIKENHELIRTGPYRITRNPIYTGFLLAFCGTSMTEGRVKGYIGFLLILIYLLIKISKEEEFLTEAFGEKFLNYRKQVKKLIPLIY